MTVDLQLPQTESDRAYQLDMWDLDERLIDRVNEDLGEEFPELYFHIFLGDAIKVTVLDADSPEEAERVKQEVEDLVHLWYYGPC